MNLAHARKGVLNVRVLVIFSDRELTGGVGVQSMSCREGNQVASKIGARIVLRTVLGLEIDADAIQLQWEEGYDNETVVEAGKVQLIDQGIVIEHA